MQHTVRGTRYAIIYTLITSSFICTGQGREAERRGQQTKSFKHGGGRPPLCFTEVPNLPTLFFIPRREHHTAGQLKYVSTLKY